MSDDLDKLFDLLNEQGFVQNEQQTYPNGGYSFYLVNEETSDVIILDCDICTPSKNGKIFPYELITEKQNLYMKKYDHLFRFLSEDKDGIFYTLEMLSGEKEFETVPAARVSSLDRSDRADISPLEYYFEKCFADVYGTKAVACLEKEYSVSDFEGHSYFLDYEVQTREGRIAVEENGIRYHHPQCIGSQAYGKQLHKQNTCTLNNIKLYWFSTEDCQFENRIEDDIRLFFGDNAGDFISPGLLLSRNFKLYDHQQVTLDDLEKCRESENHSALVVLPTASGKSRIAEEDLNRYLNRYPKSRALILAPSNLIVQDWKNRVNQDLSKYKNNISIYTYQYMSIHYHDYKNNYYKYIICDEAHHTVAPAWKRAIQYFTPDFLLGMTATDQRPDKKKLQDIFGSYSSELSLMDAMKKHIIAEARVYRIKTNLDLSRVRVNGKDYVNADLEQKIRVESRNEVIAEVLKKYFGEGRFAEMQGLVFCVNIAHTGEMARVLNAHGLSAASFSSKEKHPEQIMRDFREHRIRFLCACNMISEGWDYPELGILVMARPTLSKVLYLQQIGRGLRRTSAKKDVYVIDVVDEYGAMVKPCSMHSVFKMNYYVPFGEITKADYKPGDMIVIGDLVERVEKIVPVDIDSFDDRYGDYLNKEQLARMFFLNTSTISSWIKKGRIKPSVVLPFGSKKLELFSPEDAEEIRIEQKIPVHNDDTVYEDFFDFLEERDYSLSYKMPFLLAFIKEMDEIGDADIEKVLDDYISFYRDRITRHLQVDRKTCPYTDEFLKNRKEMKKSMLKNPFEKFERKHFIYYSRDLGRLSMNHALLSELTAEDYDRIRNQMNEDLVNYYRDMGGV